MGKNEDQNQREQGIESGNSEGHPGFLCGRCWIVLTTFSNEFSFRCVFVLFLSLSVLLPGIFWIFPFSSTTKSGFDAKQAIKLSAPVHAYFTLEKPVSELVQHIEKLEYDIFEEIGVPDTKVAILSMHRSGASNSTCVVFGFLPDPINGPINAVSLSVLRSSLIELFFRHSNLSLTTSIFGKPSEFEILKFPGGITITPLQSASIWQMTQILFNFTLYNSISEVDDKFNELKDQLKYGLHLRSYENLFVQLTNKNGSTVSSPVIVQASVMSDGFGSLLPQRLKQLAQTITGSPAKNLGLNNSVFGRVKSISLSSYLKGTLHPTPPTPSPAPSPGPSMIPRPSFSPAHSPAPAPEIHHPSPCPNCKPAAPSSHSPLQSPGPDSGLHPTFPPSISPAPSSAVTHPSLPCPYSRPTVAPSAAPKSHSSHMPHHPPVLSPRSKLSPGLPPLPSVSYGSSPDQGMDGTKDPVSAPPAQSPSSIAVGVLPKEIWLSAFLALLTFLLCL